MRNCFINRLIKLAEIDERIVLLTADLGFSVLEEFANKFPTRFYNVGVSEQNMVGVATGLAESGFIPFTYSIAPFYLQKAALYLFTYYIHCSFLLTLRRL